MIRKNSFWLALPVLIGLSGAALCQEKTGDHANGKKHPIPETARDSCRTIAAILAVYPTLEVRLSEGAVRDPQDGAERFGCRVHASGPTSGMTGEVQPEESIRFLLGESGWEEDPRYAADGPGTTSFALRKRGVLCFFSGGAHSWIEDGKTWTSESHDFEAGCAAERLY